MTPKTSLTSSGDQVRNGLCTTVNRQDRFVGTLWGPFRIKEKRASAQKIYSALFNFGRCRFSISSHHTCWIS